MSIIYALFLQVNGIQLMGLNHLEVVSILKQLPNFVSLVCARYPVPTRIIDTAQHRDAFQARVRRLSSSLFIFTLSIFFPRKFQREASRRLFLRQIMIGWSKPNQRRQLLLLALPANNAMVEVDLVLWNLLLGYLCGVQRLPMLT